MLMMRVMGGGSTYASYMTAFSIQGYLPREESSSLLMDPANAADNITSCKTADPSLP